MRLCETTWDSETAGRVQALLGCPVPCVQGCPYVRGLPSAGVSLTIVEPEGVTQVTHTVVA